MHETIRSATLLLVLLNPFLVIVYLVDAMDKLDPRQFRGVLLRAGLIATVVFCTFVLVGDAMFSRFLQVDFASFRIFGGLIFLLIGIQFVFRGPSAIEILRGESEHLAGAIAMPVLIGPGTISASVIIGQRHSAPAACGVIAGAVFASILIMLLLKLLHDFVKPRNARLIERYIEIFGRITALVIGTIAIEMIMQGLQVWVQKF